MITKFDCSCGNSNPNDAILYDGCLGYEAIICKKCYKYSDHSGEHPRDEWSRRVILLL